MLNPERKEHYSCNMDPSNVNLLEYLRSKTQIDLDSFDVTGKMIDGIFRLQAKLILP